MVAGVGLLGAVVATFTVKLSGDWTIAYFIGGGMGFLLLLLRVGVLESGMYKNLTNKAHVSKGNFLAFFTDWNRFTKYLRCIGIGMPTWFCIGILVYLSNQFGETFGFTEKVEPGLAIMWAYVGISAGDFLSGFLSHWLASRKKAIAFMMGMSLLGVLFYLFGGMQSAFTLYATCVWLGFWTGYWAMFVTVGAEQFGTNLRATAATTVPNMVRGSVAGMTTLFGFWKPQFGVIWAAASVGLIIYIIGFYSTLTIAETHDKDLDYLEN